MLLKGGGEITSHLSYPGSGVQELVLLPALHNVQHTHTHTHRTETVGAAVNV